MSDSNTPQDTNGWSVTSSDSVEDTSKKISDFFTAEGYQLESGSATDGMYGIGSHTLRIWFGVFIKRYVFHIKVDQNGGSTVVSVETGMTGVSGGVIGYKQLKKELTRIREAVEKQLS